MTYSDVYRNVTIDGLEMAQDVRWLSPTIIIALDKQGRSIAERVASLVRAQVRGSTQRGDETLHKRFAFLEIEEPQNETEAVTPTQVRAIQFQQSAKLWDLEQEVDAPTFSTNPHGSDAFSTIFSQAVREVLAYTEAREHLLANGVAIRPLCLQIFIVGAVMPEDPKQLDKWFGEYFKSKQMPDPAQALGDTLQNLQQMIQRKLKALETVASVARTFAEQSASVESVIRGGFLTIALPDNTGIARSALNASGSDLRRLLDSPTLTRTRVDHGSAFATVQGDIRRQSVEPPLHFLSLHTAFDEHGAYYEPRQLINVVASAIYGLTMSEVFDHDIFRVQLGIQDLTMQPEERLVSIAASRSAFPKADLLDYAALRYGAYLIDQLFPTQQPSTEQHQLLQEWIRTELRFPELHNLIERDTPTTLRNRTTSAYRGTRMIQQTRPPLLNSLIAVPRFNPLRAWPAFIRSAFNEIDFHARLLEQIAAVVDVNQGIQGFFAPGAAPIDVALSDGSRVTRKVGEIAILQEWNGWSKRLDHYFLEESLEVNWRISRLQTLVNNYFWGEVPPVFRVGGVAVISPTLLIVEDEIDELQNAINTQHEAPPDSMALNTLANNTRDLLTQRAEPAFVTLLALVISIIATYFLVALPPTAPALLREFVARPDIAFEIEALNLRFALPMVVIGGSVLGGVVWITGLVLIVFQSIRIYRSLEQYAHAVRENYANYLAAEELRGLRTIPEYLRTMVTYLRMEEEVHRKEAEATSSKLRERADTIAKHGFSDMSEYVPIPGADALSFYREWIEPRFASTAQQDLVEVRRLVQRKGLAISSERVCTAEHIEELRQGARKRLYALVVGDRGESEYQLNISGIRQLAYVPVRDLLDRYVRHRLAKQLAERARYLVDRTPFLLRQSDRTQQLTFAQSYLVTNIAGIRGHPVFLESVYVRSLDPEMIMYIRVVCRAWPRLFAEADIRLSGSRVA